MADAINLSDLASALLGPENAKSLGNYLTESGQSLYDGPRNMLHDLIGEAGPSTLQGMSGAASSALSAPIRAASGGNAGFGTAVDAVMNPLTLNQWGDRAERYYDPLEQRFSQENEALMKPVSAAGEAYLNHPLGMGFAAPKAAEGVSDAANVAKNYVEENASGADQVNMFGGPRGAARLAQLGRPAAQEAMDLAAKMHRQGATQEEIWDATTKYLKDRDPGVIGVVKGSDGILRYETPDNKLELRKVKSTPGHMVTDENGEKEYIGPSGTFTSFSHPDLIGPSGAYEFKERVRGKYGPGEGGGLYYRPMEPEMVDWYTQAGSKPSPERAFGKILATGDTRDAARSTLAHEVMHGVQFREGFAAGGSPKIFTPEEVAAEKDNILQNGMKTDRGTMFFTRPASVTDNLARHSLYTRLGGEDEAANVQTRLDYTPDERIAEPPFESQRTPSDQHILRDQWGQPYDHTKFDARMRPIIPAVAGGALAAGALSPDDAHAEGAGHMGQEVTDPDIIRQLEAAPAHGGQEVTDPEILRQLENDFDSSIPQTSKNHSDTFWGKVGSVINPTPQEIELEQRRANIPSTSAGGFAPGELANASWKTGLSGVPIIGKGVQQDDATRYLEENAPASSAAQKAAFGTAAMAPIVAAAPGAFGMTGTLGTRLASGSLTGGSINAADKALDGGSTGDVAKSFGLGALTGMVPGVISPNLPKWAADSIVDKWFPRIATATGAGTSIMHGDIMPALEGSVAGYLGLPKAIKEPLKSYLTNDVTGDLARTLSRPTTQAASETLATAAKAPRFGTKAAYSEALQKVPEEELRMRAARAGVEGAADLGRDELIKKVVKSGTLIALPLAFQTSIPSELAKTLSQNSSGNQP